MKVNESHQNVSLVHKAGNNNRAYKGRWSDAGFILCQRRRRWTNKGEPTLADARCWYDVGPGELGPAINVHL